MLLTVADASHVLVLRWHHRANTLVVGRGTSPGLNTAITQRVVLSVVSPVYDSIGLNAPYTVKARLLLKDIWRLNRQQWGDDLPEAVVTQFGDWSSKLLLLIELAFPRSYFQETVEGLELHFLGTTRKTSFVR